MKITNQLPKQDYFLNIWLEQGNISTWLPEYEDNKQECVLLYEIDENDLQMFICNLKIRSRELSKRMKEIDSEAVFDIQIKPVLLFERKESAEMFAGFLGSCTEEEQYEIFHELQLEHNEPWGKADCLTHKQVEDILDHYVEILAE